MIGAIKGVLRPTPTAASYERVFEAERLVEYPVVDAFEKRMGYAIDRAKLEAAARVLACPLKAHAPNWQHGRVLSALVREYTVRTVANISGPFMFLDIGTAKGFSAVSMALGLVAEGVAEVFSVDVIDPNARVKRNTVAEVDGYKTLQETLAPWPIAAFIHFEQSTGIDWLKRHPERIHVAFVDGKHNSDVVVTEGKLLADRQEPGDVVMFDDVQIPGVAMALASLDAYEFEQIDLVPVNRMYAIGKRR